MDVNEKLTELFSLLDDNEDIKSLMSLKGQISSKEIALVNDYRNHSTIENKEKLYENDLIKKYLLTESRVNLLIMEINCQFKRSHLCRK